MLKLAPASGGRTGRHPWVWTPSGSRRLTVGDLMALCEENYRLLRGLIPDVRALNGELRSGQPDGMSLHLEIIEQAPYTTLLRLTYLFPHDDGKVHHIPRADPDALLRAYHDAGQVEVLDLRQTALPLHNHYRSPALEAKWRANWFISKWLVYCVGQGHSFPRRQVGVAEPGAEGASCTLP